MNNTNWAVLSQSEDVWVDTGITLMIPDFEDDLEIMGALASCLLLPATTFDLDGDENEITVSDANSGLLLYVLQRSKRRLRIIH